MVESFEMGELIDALVRVLEFVVQGALAILLIGFVLAWIHGLKASVYEHVREITEYMLGRNWATLKLHPNALIAIIVGALYITGVITNSVGYWLLDPAHELVISEAAPSSAAQQPKPVAPLSLMSIVAARVLLGASPPPNKEYVTYLKEEVAWRNEHLDAVKHALDPLLKQNRVIRGTVVISLGFLVVSILKVASCILSALLLTLPAPLHAAGEFLYRHVVDPKHGQTPTDGKKGKRLRRETTLKYALSNLMYAAVAFVVLYCALGGYATTEREYHIMAHAGVLSAKPETSSAMNASATPANGNARAADE